MVGSHLVLKKTRSDSAKVLKLSVESDVFGALSAANISCLLPVLTHHILRITRNPHLHPVHPCSAELQAARPHFPGLAR